MQRLVDETTPLVLETTHGVDHYELVHPFHIPEIVSTILSFIQLVEFSRKQESQANFLDIFNDKGRLISSEQHQGPVVRMRASPHFSRVRLVCRSWNNVTRLLVIHCSRNTSHVHSAHIRRFNDFVALQSRITVNFRDGVMDPKLAHWEWLNVRRVLLLAATIAYLLWLMIWDISNSLSHLASGAVREFIGFTGAMLFWIVQLVGVVLAICFITSLVFIQSKSGVKLKMAFALFAGLFVPLVGDICTCIIFAKFVTQQFRIVGFKPTTRTILFAAWITLCVHLIRISQVIWICTPFFYIISGLDDTLVPTYILYGILWLLEIVVFVGSLVLLLCSDWKRELVVKLLMVLCTTLLFAAAQVAQFYVEMVTLFSLPILSLFSTLVLYPPSVRIEV